MCTEESVTTIPHMSVFWKSSHPILLYMVNTRTFLGYKEAASFRVVA